MPRALVPMARFSPKRTKFSVSSRVPCSTLAIDCGWVSPRCLATAGRRRSRSMITVRMSGWCARLKARLRPTVVLPQPAVGEVTPTEVQPLSRIIRTALVRIMSKVVCTGSRRSKVTMRFCRITAGAGVKLSSSAQTGPAARGAGQARPSTGRRGAPEDAAAGAAARCSLAFWIAAWMRSIIVSYAPRQNRLPRPTAAPARRSNRSSGR